MSGSPGIATNSTNAQQRIFRITDIPDVMQFKKGWPIAARLMRRWFAAPANQMNDLVKRNYPGASIHPLAIDQTTVTMNWLLLCGRARVVHDQLLASWDSPAGRQKMIGDIRRQMKPGKNEWRFGDLTKSPYEVDQTCQVNFREVGSLMDPLDDFYGAIGKGTIKLAVTGVVSRLENGRYRIAIDEIATYLRDTYDFNDKLPVYSQPLGYWGWQGVERDLQLRWDIAIDELPASADTPTDRLYAVQNEDFRAYRTKYGRGGDFVIYSDLRRTKLTRPVVVEF